MPYTSPIYFPNITRSPARAQRFAVAFFARGTYTDPVLNCRIGKTGTILEFSAGEKGTVRRGKNVCACSPPKNRYDTIGDSGSLVENLRIFSTLPGA